MKKTFVLALMTLTVAALSAQTLPSGVKKMASMGGITEYDYPNGLKVLLYPDPAEPKITINVTYLVGSRHEGYGETGMAHLLEHMDFIETTTWRKIKNEITAHASKWKGPTNDDGRTNYHERLPRLTKTCVRAWPRGLPHVDLIFL
jgi:zinc protease